MVLAPPSKEDVGFLKMSMGFDFLHTLVPPLPPSPSKSEMWVVIFPFLSTTSPPSPSHGRSESEVVTLTLWHTAAVVAASPPSQLAASSWRVGMVLVVAHDHPLLLSCKDELGSWVVQLHPATTNAWH
ncbi:hypothetical protein CPB84DRAFT_1746454 [Gymnopilus junonius]|uniref:Uncharacterized protein n=1 Tax=Gymnopilus junonius TaxID=109634 RepID=A0A9P5NNF1_GYMJU|nr:hypothetical protein CPB84DRAFT_1746454 [Gymnopilus junonius]